MVTEVLNITRSTKIAGGVDVGKAACLLVVVAHGGDIVAQHLASDVAARIHGEDVAVDGGRLIAKINCATSPIILIRD